MSIKNCSFSTKDIFEQSLPTLERLRLKDFQLKLKIRHNQHEQYSLTVEKNMQEMLDNDIIERVGGPIQRVSPLVAARKPNRDIRIGAGLSISNKAIERTRNPK